MYEKKLFLNNIKAIKDFSAVINSCKADCVLLAEDHKYIVDAKSIMGIFSLDLSRPVVLRSADNIDKETENKIAKYFI